MGRAKYRSRLRRGAGVVERGGLENRCALTRTVGSNPTPSANQSVANPRFSPAPEIHYTIQLRMDGPATGIGLSPASMNGPGLILGRFSPFATMTGGGGEDAESRRLAGNRPTVRRPEGGNRGGGKQRQTNVINGYYHT